jgi:predicted double-glycine peptidase
MMMAVWRCLSGALILPLLMLGVSFAGGELTQAGSDMTPAAVTRHSLKELRDRHVVKQRLDYSCGAAALATLLRYYFGEETSEQDIIERLKARLTKDEMGVKAVRGFSLLDLKYVAQEKGYRAAGFKLTLEQLGQLAAPTIVPVQPFGYKHFAVLRGVDRGRVFLADPARGNLRMSLERFSSEWDGIVFVLGRAGEEAITTFPLALPRPEHIQPELLSASRLSDPRPSMIDLAIRSQVR